MFISSHLGKSKYSVCTENCILFVCDWQLSFIIDYAVIIDVAETLLYRGHGAVSLLFHLLKGGASDFLNNRRVNCAPPSLLLFFLLFPILVLWCTVTIALGTPHSQKLLRRASLFSFSFKTPPEAVKINVKWLYSLYLWVFYFGTGWSQCSYVAIMLSDLVLLVALPDLFHRLSYFGLLKIRRRAGK